MVLTIIIFQGVIFVVLIFALRQFMQGHVTGAVGHLQKLNDELQRQQAELTKKMAAAEKEYQVKMARLQQDINSAQAQAKQEAAKTVEEARARAIQERDQLINEAVGTREKMRQEVMAEMEDRAIQHSRSLMTDFFGGELRRLVHEALVREVLEGLKGMDLEKFQITEDEAHLASIEPLPEETKGLIRKLLKEKIHREVKFKEDIDPNLGGGLVLRFGTFVIDGSLTNRLKESSALLKKETARRYQGTT